MYDHKQHPLSLHSRLEMTRLQNFKSQNELRGNALVNAPPPKSTTTQELQIPKTLARKVTKAYSGYTNDLLSILYSHM
jgi:pseudouridine-5'-phosphate glycosidase